jgi:hypothetical protein
VKETETKTTTHTHTKREEKRERDGDNLHDAVAMISGAHKLPDPQSRIPCQINSWRKCLYATRLKTDEEEESKCPTETPERQTLILVR